MRAFVRSAMYTYLTSPAVSGVDWVFPGIPYDQAGVAWDEVVVAGQEQRCFLVIHIGDSADYGERVFVFDGAGGRRLVDYPVSIAMYFEDISGDPQAALAIQEQTLDNLLARMRADPSIGQPSTSGLVSVGVPDIRVSPGVLEKLGDGDTFSSWSELAFTAVMYEYST